METRELSKMPKQELLRMLKDEREKLRQLRFDLKSGKVKNVREIRRIRKEIARIMTFISFKEEKKEKK